MPFPTCTQPDLSKEPAFIWSAAREQSASDTGGHSQGCDFSRNNAGSSGKGYVGVRLENYRQQALLTTPKQLNMNILFW